jgi:hypothetical protein
MWFVGRAGIISCPVCQDEVGWNTSFLLADWSPQNLQMSGGRVERCYGDEGSTLGSGSDTTFIHGLYPPGL